MSRRVLIVVSSYAPTMIADMQRARHLAWTLPDIGWEVEILTPDSSFQKLSCLDADSSGFFAGFTPVHQVSPKWKLLFDLLKMGNIGWRALIPLLTKGRELLRTDRFDLVYFSTTQFPLFLLGRLWYRKYEVPYVLDFHDPCFREEQGLPVWAKPSLRHRLSWWLAKHIESWSLSKAAGVVAVSPAYIDTFKKRYTNKDHNWKLPGHAVAIPFGVLPKDFEAAQALKHKLVSRAKSAWSIVYVGAGGPIMRRSFGLLCQVLAEVGKASPDLLDGVTFELKGTQLGWQEGAPQHLADVAASYNVSAWVHEDPRRVSYRQSLENLMSAEGALVLGVEDDGYMPSKLFSYACSGKPLLAVLRRKSPAFAFFEANPGLGHALWFDEYEHMPECEAIEILGKYLHEVKARKIFDRQTALQPFMAADLSRQHSELFELCSRKIDGSKQ